MESILHIHASKKHQFCKGNNVYKKCAKWCALNEYKQCSSTYFKYNECSSFCKLFVNNIYCVSMDPVQNVFHSTFF